MSTHFPPDRTFYMLIGLKKGWDDFEIIGVFSLEKDALTTKDELESSGLYDLVLAPQDVHMDVVIDELIKSRLGKLHDVLLKIESKLKP